MDLHYLQKVLDVAEQGQQWVVILCSPDRKPALSMLLGSMGQGVFSGRTLRFPNGGRVSIASPSEDVFVPTGTPFKLCLLAGVVGGAWNEKAEGALAL